MKHFTHLIFIATITLLAAMVLFVHRSVAQSAYNFAYLITTDQGADLLIVDANNPNITAVRRNYPIPEGWSPTRQAFMSPDGNWIATALLSNDQQRLMIQLYNMLSGEIYEVVEGAISTNGRNIAWSPDSRYLGLNIALDTASLNTFVYSVSDGMLTSLTNDNADHYDIGWSPTSTHLASFLKMCNEGNICLGRLEIFNVINGQREVSVDLPITFGNSIACGLTISPDIQQVAFVARCGSQPEVATDIYLWDVTKETVIQVTDLFAAEPNEAPVWAAYNLAWLETQTLLIGLDYQLFTQPEAKQLLTYNTLQNITELLSTMVGTSFAVNPSSDQVAVLVERTASDISSSNTDQIVILSTNEIIGISDGLSEQGTINVPSGCELNWSPDGRLLSYTTYSEDDCRGDITGFVFVDPITGVTQQHLTAIDGITADNVVITSDWIAG